MSNFRHILRDDLRVSVEERANKFTREELCLSHHV